MFTLSGLEWILVVVASIFIGFSKAGFSGAGLLVVVLMAWVFPAKESTGIIVPMLIFADMFALLFWRRHGEAKILLRLFPFAVPGVVAGFIFMGRVNSGQLKQVIGWVVLFMVVVNFLLNRRMEGRVFRSLPLAGAAGLSAGFTTMVANAAGPVMTVYFLAMKVEKEKFLGNMAWFFALINLFKAPFSLALGLITVESLKFNVLMFPVVFCGAVGGYFLVRVISQKAFDIAVQVLAAASAVNLIVS